MSYSDAAIDAFDRFALETTRKRVMHNSLLFSLIFWAAFVIGQFSLGEMPEARLERVWLPVQAIACGVCWGGMRYVPVAQRHPVAVASSTYAIVAWAGGTLLGALGGLDGPFFYNIYVIPPLVMVLPCSLRDRLGITAALLVPYVLAYFLPHPEYFEHRLLHIPAIYLLAITVVSVLLGNWIYGLTRDRFLFARQIEEQRALLADHNVELTEAVTTKTQVVDDLSARLETVRVDERSELARTLHDDLGQLIVGARMELGNVERVRSHEDSRSETDLSFLLEIIESLATSTKRIVGELRDEEPNRAANVAESIEALAATLRGRTDLEITTAVRLDATLSMATGEAIYRTVQESLTNVLKHADAKRVRVAVEASESEGVVVVVSDDGVGFDVDLWDSGWGLVGIRERAESLGGELRIESDHTGTRLEMHVPIDG